MILRECDRKEKIVVYKKEEVDTCHLVTYSLIRSYVFIFSIGLGLEKLRTRSNKIMSLVSSHLAFFSFRQIQFLLQT